MTGRWVAGSRQVQAFTPAEWAVKASPTRQTLSARNKVARVAWKLVWLCLYRPSPIVLHAWRCELLRFFGANVGKRVHPYPSSRVWAPWNLTLRDDSCLA